MNAAHQAEQYIARRRFSSVIGCAALSLTAARPNPQAGAIASGVAAAVASFNAADARSRATHLRTGWSPSAETHPCNRRCRGKGPEMPARRISARPAAPTPGATGTFFSGGVFARSQGRAFFSFVHGANFCAHPFPNAYERFAGVRNAV